MKTKRNNRRKSHKQVHENIKQKAKDSGRRLRGLCSKAGSMLKKLFSSLLYTIFSIALRPSLTELWNLLLTNTNVRETTAFFNQIIVLIGTTLIAQ